MKINPKIINLLFFLLMFGKHQMAIGQEYSLNLPSNSISSKADYALLIDNSTSIKDPADQQLMRQAVRLFVDVLEEGDKLAIITFGEQVNILGREELIADRNSRKRRIDEFTLSFSEDESDITSAFEKLDEIGPTFWRQRDRLNQQIPKVIILVSDGRLFVGKGKSIQQSYNRLVDLRGRFINQGIEINCLDLETDESDDLLHKDDLRIVGGDLLKGLASKGENNYQRLEELVSVIDNYMKIVRLNKATTTFGSLTGPIEINQTVKEVRLFILKKDKKFQDVQTKDIEIKFGDGFSFSYQVDLESGKKLENGIFVKWNEQNGFDIITIDPSELTGHDWDEIPLIEIDFEGVYYNHVYHLPSDKDIGHLVCDVPTINLLNHPIRFLVKVYERDQASEGSNGTLIRDCEVFGKILSAEDPESKGSKQYSLPFDSGKGAFVFDLQNTLQDLQPGDFQALFTARLLNMGAEVKYSRPYRFSVLEDYLRPKPLDIISGNNRSTYTIRPEVEINKGIPEYAKDFDPNRSLTMVLAQVFRNGQLEKSDTLEFQTQEGDVETYLGEIELQDIGNYELQYLLIGTKVGGNRNPDPIVSQRYPVANIDEWIFYKLYSWLKRLLLILFGLAVILVVRNQLRPQISFDLAIQSGHYPPKDWKPTYAYRKARKHLFEQKNQQAMYRFAVTSGLNNGNIYLKNKGATIYRHRDNRYQKIGKGAKVKIKSKDSISFGKERTPKYKLIILK